MSPNDPGDARPVLSDAVSSDSDSDPEDSMLLIRSKSPRRVKVYFLQGDDWLDNGTGYCMGRVELKTHKPYFIVRNELDSKDVILRSYLEGSIQYQRQQETLIVWSDSSGKDLALSFQENEGCTDLCNFIVKVQQENLSPMISLYYVVGFQVNDGSANGSRENTELITGPITYPPKEPTSEDLAEMLDGFVQAANSLYSRFKVLSFVVENEYFSRLYDLFVQCEARRDLASLHFLHDITKTLLAYNENILFNDIFCKELSVLSLAGMLEYDRKYPKFKAEHRNLLIGDYRFACLRALRDAPLFPGLEINILRMEHILTYFRSVFLSINLEDHVVSTLSSMIYKCQLDILNFMRRSQANGNFLESLFKLYESRDTEREQQRDEIRMIHYFVMTAKSHVASVKPEFFGYLTRCGFSRMITAALEDPCSEIRALGTELVVILLDQDVLLANTASSNESHVDALEDLEDHAAESVYNEDATPRPLRLKLIYDVSLSISLSHVLMQSREAGLQVQAYEALKAVLCAAAAEISAMKDGRGFDEEVQKKEDDANSSDLSHIHHHQFYTFVAPILFVDYIDLASEDSSKRQQAESNLMQRPELHQYICEIISYCSREHDREICRGYLLRTGLFRGLFGVLTLRVNVLLKLAAIRCIKSALYMNDLEVSKYVVQHDLFAHFFSFFEAVVLHNSCTNSLCLDLLYIVEKQASQSAGLVVARYVYETYRDFLDTRLSYVFIGNTLPKAIEAAEKLENDELALHTLVCSNRLSSPISEGAIGEEWPTETSNGVQSVVLFKDLKLQNASKRQSLSFP